MPEKPRQQYRGQGVAPDVIRGHRVIKGLPGKGDAVFRAGKLLGQLHHHRARLEFRVRFKLYPQPSEAARKPRFRSVQRGYGSGIGRARSRGLQRRHRAVTRRDNARERIAFVLHIRLDGLNDVRDQIITAGQLHLYLGKGILESGTQRDQSVVYGNEHYREHRGNHNSGNDNNSQERKNGCHANLLAIQASAVRTGRIKDVRGRYAKIAKKETPPWQPPRQRAPYAILQEDSAAPLFPASAWGTLRAYTHPNRSRYLNPPFPMQHSSLKLLPGPDTLSARLALFLLAMVLAGMVLLLFAIFDVTSLAPVDTQHTFSWVVMVGACGLLLMAGVLWFTISREVLRPLEQIREVIRQEESGAAGLGQVAATMRELRETVHRTQAELDESNKNLRQVEKLAMVGKLAAGVAHSVRNPLTSVKLRLFSLERSLTLAPRQQEDFAVIADAIRHVDGIVSNFLEFSRRPQLRLEQVTVSAVVDATLQLLESRLAVFPVSISLRRSPNLPEVCADPEQLREALLNILLNACEAMDYSGNLAIEETLLSAEDGSRYVCIRVQDSGPGIPEDVLPEIFTPFFSTKEQGTGLGLPIAKGILEEHGGDLQVSSSPRTGTIFTLMLPAE